MSSRLSIAISPKLKNNANKVFNNMGLSLSTAVKMFLQQTINDHALPFKPHEAMNPNYDYHTQRAVNQTIKNLSDNNIKKHHLVEK